ncbi:UNVERIFIED_CONTAM: hypothetical protein FKN15_002318 [Acipenser sinensis]
MYITFWKCEYFQTWKTYMVIIAVVSQGSFNGDMIPDVFGAIKDSPQTHICYLNGRNMSWQKALDTDAKMRIPHSHAFIDVNKDFTAGEPILSYVCAEPIHISQRLEYNWDGNFSKGTSLLNIPDNVMKTGQSAFSDFDGDGFQDHLLPVCEDDGCHKSAIYLNKPGTEEWIPILKDFQKKDTLWGFVPLETSALHNPITLHLGDYNMDGFPDALAILRNTSGSNQQAFLLENVPCANVSCRGAGRMFRVFWELSDLNQITDAVVATFFDIYEDLQKGTTGQLSQSAHFALQLPYTVLGLGRSANFLDHLYVGIPRPPGEKAIRKQEWTAIIPNSQLIVIPYPHNNPRSWSAKLYLTPSNIVLLTAIALIAVCVFILVIIGILHWQEKVLADIPVVLFASKIKPRLATKELDELYKEVEMNRDVQNVGAKLKPGAQCGTWIRNHNGGLFTSPNYPDTYPPNKECVYILEAAPRQRIELSFDDPYYVEPSFECRFDHLEIRDGPFGFSPLIDRYCGPKSPGLVRSTGRVMWIKFTTDGEVHVDKVHNGRGTRGAGFPYPDFTYMGGILSPIPADCQFELSGADGVIRSGQVEEDDKIKPGQAVDCIWTVRAPPKAKIYLRFLEYQMEHSNECKKNFVAVYDGNSAIENLKAKFCSTVANDIMLETGTGVVRMWADESSRLSRFRMLFTSFVEPPCSGNTFFCHSNMCINSSLVCNGVQNCVYPWDENHCKEKKTNGLFHQITKTHGTIIGVSSGIVLVLLIISILVQVKQPRKKVLARKPAFNKSGFQEVFDPPHYELFSLRDKEISSDLADLSEELENYHKMRRSSTASRCIHDHHCGGQPSMVKESRTNLGSMELPYRNDFSQPQPMKTFNSTFKKSCHGYKQTHDCAEQVIEDRVMEEIPCEIYVRGSRNNDAVQRSMSIDF